MNTQEVLNDLDNQIIPEYNLTRGELKSHFEKVQNPEGWKLPINVVIDIVDLKDMELIRNAVIFFTGSVPKFYSIGLNKYRVKAAGYYAAMGA